MSASLGLGITSSSPSLQANTLSCLQYQNTLLSDRNKILTLENQSLLGQLSERSSLAWGENRSPNTSQQFDKRRGDQLVEAVRNLIKSLQGLLSRETPKPGSSSFHIVNKMLDNQCPAHTIVQSLGEIIKEQADQKIAQKKNDYHRIIQALRKRKQSHVRKEKIKTEYLHVVKEPHWGTTSNIEDLGEKDCDFLLRNTQKLSKIIKRKQISSCDLDDCFDGLRKACKTRQYMRQANKEIVQKERQMELGVPCSVTLEELCGHVGELRSQYQGLIQQLQTTIHCL